VCKPFLHQTPNVVGIHSLASLILTTAAALVMPSPAAGSGKGSSSATVATVAVAAAALFVNVVFLVWFAWRVVCVIDWSVVSSKASKVPGVGGCLYGKQA
jgi:hypothetical protein